MKKTVESSGSVGGFKTVLSRKKRRSSVLKDNAGAKEGSAKVQSGHSWGSETGYTTESDSVDMEKECLVEETSFDYGEGIIKAMFTSESGLMKATEKATGANIMVNTNLKRLAGRSDRAVVLKEILVGISAEAVHATLSEFGTIKSIKIQLVGLWQKAMIEFEHSDHANLVAAKWSILIRKDAVQVARSDLDKES
ncbi:hypothetical protein G9A89_000101 [Geosiphon pyriformis]|nr:hypothetical protein G9A89_000101 [Geosiphon pyriformis]